MKKTAIILTVCSLLLPGYSLFATNASADPVNDIKSEIEKIKLEDAAYYYQELLNDNASQRTSMLRKLGFDDKSAEDPAVLKDVAEKMVDDSYIYYMDESGTVYDKNAEFYAKVDVSPVPTEDESLNNITPYAFENPRINGDSTGAFIRQTSVKGYIGSRTQYVLPSNKASGFSIPEGTAVGYIYNGLDLNAENNPNIGITPFVMEGGVQASQALNNFSAYIRVNGGALDFTDDTGKIPPRFSAGTSFASNLRYETTTGKVKYYASGTNINGVAQNLSFTYAKTFSSTEIANMRAKRVLGLATSGYDGTQDIGYIKLKYTGATLLKTDGSTTVNYNTSLLDTNLYNNKVYGTGYWPKNKVSYSPTSGDISTQSQSVVTN